MPGSAKSLTLWLARASWVLVAVVGGGGIGDAMADRSRAVQLTATIAAWAVWAVVAVLLAVPAALGLTLIRMIVPGAVVASIATLVSAGATTGTVLAVVTTALAASVIGSGEFGQQMVQASAYGDERRFLLRAPAAFYLPTVVSWTLWCAAIVVGPLALAARAWVVGIPVSAFAVVATWFLLPRFHRLARRWIVLVPAGVVVHDHVVLAETVMFRAGDVTRARLALADTQAADLTGPAGGHAVEVAVRDAVTVVLAGTRERPNGTALHVYAFLCAPTRPGRLLHALADHHLPVG